jgi:nucleoside-diphosphate-sugar epimerase
MRSAILGYTGLVGSHIADGVGDAVQINRSNLGALSAEPFDWLYISAMPAEKWKANRFPQEDAASLESLKQTLSGSRASRIVLISTVDVYTEAQKVDEDSDPDPAQQNAYGRNRLHLERFVQSTFEQAWVVRLPGLVSPRLKKNLLFDLKNKRSLAEVPINARFQFYPLNRLGEDLAVVQKNRAGIYHFAPQPLGVSEIAERLGIESGSFAPPTQSPPNYDFWTKFGGLWGVGGNYIVSKSESFEAIEEYLA